MLDPRIAAALEGFNALPVDRTGTPAERRARARVRPVGSAAAIVSHGPDLHAVADLKVPTPHGGVLVRVYRPRPGLLPGYLYIHGGGWWQGSVEDADAGCRRRARATDCVVASVEYRLAPEHPFPAGLDDCWAVAKWLFGNASDLGVDAERIVIGGGSAGGNLAAAVTLLARDAGGPRFVGQVLEVPGMDLTFRDESFELYGDGYIFTKEDLRECAGFYAAGADLTNPLISPLYAELHHLPPALITTAEYDPVRDPAEAYAAKLQAAGGDATLHRSVGLVHGAGEMDALIPDIAQQYLDVVVGFLDRAFGRTPAETGPDAAASQNGRATA